MAPDEAVQGLRQAAKRRKRIEASRREATEQLRKRILEAQKAGVPIARIAREANLSRQGVYDFLGDQRPSRQA